MENFKDYLDNYWMKDPQNQGKSFTYACAMYDYGTIPEEILDIVIEDIHYESGANIDWLEGQRDSTLLEMVDFAHLSEIIDDYFDEDEEDEN